MFLLIRVSVKGGIINLGTAVNQLCEDVLHEKLNQVSKSLDSFFGIELAERY